jgi:hypothetical protein
MRPVGGRSPTRETARDALIERWDADRQAHPEASRLILTHTNAECDELNAQARDRLRDHGTLGADVAVETTRGQRLFADQDRIMFLRNERELGVKNGMLATIERVDRTGMAVRLDDGRAVASTTRTMPTSTTATRPLCTSLKGRRSTGSMSWQRLGSIAMAPMSRSRAIAITSRCITARPTLPTASGWPSGYRATGPRTWRATTPARTKTEKLSLAQPPASAEPERKRGRFAGLRLNVPSFAKPLAPDKQAHRDLPKPTLAAAQQIQAEPSLEQAVERYARATAEIDRMTRQQLPALEYQKTAQARAAQALNALAGGSARSRHCLPAQPWPHGEASGAAPATPSAPCSSKQKSAPIPNCAPIASSSWQQLQAQRGSLTGSSNREARQQVEGQMRAMAKGLEKDPALRTHQARGPADRQTMVAGMVAGRQWP